MRQRREERVARGSEQARLAAQASLDRSNPSERRSRLGQFATPPELAEAILEVCRQQFGPGEAVLFLDPGGGTGAFFSALLRTFGRERVARAVTYEIDRGVARVAERLWSSHGLEVRCRDFTTAHEELADAAFNLVVCNPPYSRHHYLSRETKLRLQAWIRAHTGLAVNGLAGMAVYFMLMAHQHLDLDGVAAWLIPSEVLDVNYGAVVREYLSSRVTTLRIHRFPSEETQFDDALVSSCVVLLRNRTPPRGHEVMFTSGKDLLAPVRRTAVLTGQLRREHKWGRLFERQTAPQAQRHGLVAIGDLFDVRRGIATGANGFFVMQTEEARRRGIPTHFLRPVLPSPRHVTGCTIHAADDSTPMLSPSLVLLDCDLQRDDVRQLWPELDRYLLQGEAQGLPQRYLLARRDPWYRQEKRAPAPLLCTYMSRKRQGSSPFRFIRNHSAAVALNVYLMMYPTRRLLRALDRAPDLLDRLHMALRDLSHHDVTGEAREYGGGLHKLEPAELGRVLVPLSDPDFELLHTEEQTRLPGI